MKIELPNSNSTNERKLEKIKNLDVTFIIYD